MKLKGIVLFIMIMLVIAALMLSGCSGGAKPQGDQTPAPAKKQLTMSTGSTGGVYNIMGSGMAKVINERVKSIEVVAVTPASMTQVPEMLQSGQAQLALGMVDMMKRATNGEGEFKGVKYDKYVPIMGCGENNMAFLVLKKSPIVSIKDMEGKKVSFTSESTKSQGAALMEAAGVDLKKVDFRFMSYQQGAEALSEGSVDAVYFSTFPRSALIDQVKSLKGARFVEIDEQTIAKYNSQYPLWSIIETPANTYSDQPKPAYGPGYYAVFYARKDVSEDDIYIITKTLAENTAAIAEVHPSGAYITTQTTKKYIEKNVIDPAQMHPGAVRYFKEQGIIK